MSLIVNLFSSLRTRLYTLALGIAAGGRLAITGILALRGSGTFGERLAAAFLQPAALRQTFCVLRAFRPNLVLSKKLIECYDNNGSALVTRAADVREVLTRDSDFEVVYGPRMQVVTGGENFFLGMQPSARYVQDVSNMRLAVRRDDVPTRVVPFVAKQAAQLVAEAGGRIDLPPSLALRVPARLLAEYFGLPGPSEQQMIEWTTILFWYLFADLPAAPEVTRRAVTATKELRGYVDGLIVERKKPGATPRDDVLGRCLAMQEVTPGMTDIGIRNNLIGLVIGAVPTTSKAAVQALDQLLARPSALAGAQAAAKSGDDDTLARYVFEALRFNPLSPVIYRRAQRDTVIARNTLRACRIPQSTMVFASNLSAMFDPFAVVSPSEFRIDRPWEDYMLWGHGMHTCFGEHINRAMIPGVLKPLLMRSGLRRAAGTAGQIDCRETPFPVHFVVEFDPS